MGQLRRGRETARLGTVYWDMITYGPSYQQRVINNASPTNKKPCHHLQYHVGWLQALAN